MDFIQNIVLPLGCLKGFRNDSPFLGNTVNGNWGLGVGLQVAELVRSRRINSPDSFSLWNDFITNGLFDIQSGNASAHRKEGKIMRWKLTQMFLYNFLYINIQLSALYQISHVSPTTCLRGNRPPKRKYLWVFLATAPTVKRTEVFLDTKMLWVNKIIFIRTFLLRNENFHWLFWLYSMNT